MTPEHYQGTVQPIDLINAHDLNFNLGNVVKYVCRAGKKDGESTEKDLNKALDYIQFELDRLKGKYKIEEEQLYEVFLLTKDIQISVYTSDGEEKSQFTKEELKEYGFTNLDGYRIERV